MELDWLYGRWIPFDPSGENGLSSDAKTYFGHKLYGEMSQQEREWFRTKGFDVLDIECARRRDDARRIELIDMMRTVSDDEMRARVDAENAVTRGKEWSKAS